MRLTSQLVSIVRHLSGDDKWEGLCSFWDEVTELMWASFRWFKCVANGVDTSLSTRRKEKDSFLGINEIAKCLRRPASSCGTCPEIIMSPQSVYSKGSPHWESVTASVPKLPPCPRVRTITTVPSETLLLSDFVKSIVTTAEACE